MTGRKLKENICTKTNSSKRTTYILMNPLLKVPTVYNNENIPEYKRVYYIRLRISSHNLKIETNEHQENSGYVYVEKMSKLSNMFYSTVLSRMNYESNMESRRRIYMIFLMLMRIPLLISYLVF